MKHIKMFTATWCGPCKMTKPIVQQIEEEKCLKVEYYDVDENKKEISDFGIKAVPTIIYLEDGVEYARTSGYLPKTKILENLEVN